MKLYLIATQVVYYVAFVLWVIFWGLAFSSILQAPTYQNTLFFTFTSFYLVAVIVCTIVAWYYHLTKKGVSIAVNLIPLLCLVCTYIYFFN